MFFLPVVFPTLCSSTLGHSLHMLHTKTLRPIIDGASSLEYILIKVIDP